MRCDNFALYDSTLPLVPSVEPLSMMTTSKSSGE